MRADTTTFLLTLIILLTTTLTSATPAPVDRRLEPATPQAFAEKLNKLDERAEIYPRGRKSGGGSSSGAGVKKAYRRIDGGVWTWGWGSAGKLIEGPEI
ncbi:hypothetical protein BGX38DRAFT_1328894 [Terfezia claveryi]|nr:hypothetical protein BGX38DRAFT_1328894 [Terfezia claveryi]